MGAHRLRLLLLECYFAAKHAKVLCVADYARASHLSTWSCIFILFGILV